LWLNKFLPLPLYTLYTIYTAIHPHLLLLLLFVAKKPILSPSTRSTRLKT